ncbi:hypothetical protein P261_02045 [Lachnospiraceae bacterium TWA4]|nr:hypothetical protein P261_02045 [Lachnospiraceae bacterium TWA4]
MDCKTITISKQDIGSFICTLNETNLINVDNSRNYSTMTISEVKNSFFYNAKIYKYKSESSILAKVKNDYYLFALSDLVDKASASQIFDFYHSSGENSLTKIEVQKNEKALSTITDTYTINSITNIIQSCKINKSLKLLTNQNMNEFLENSLYTLKMTFENHITLKVYIYKDYIQFNILQKDNYGYYPISPETYEKLTSLIN